MAAATFCCSLFLFACNSNSNEQETQEEIEESITVDEMLKRDSIIADSLKKELLK